MNTNNLHFAKSTFSPSVIKLPNGKYTLVGSIPSELMIEKTNHVGQKYMDSPIYLTEKDAQNAIADALGHARMIEVKQ